MSMDMPSNCGECKLQDMCLRTKGCLPFYIRDDECPLKGIPEKKEIRHMENLTEYLLREGYNDCIDDILRGE